MANGAQFGREDALHVSLEGVAVDRAAEDEGRDQPARGERADESGCRPVAVREAHAQ